MSNPLVSIVVPSYNNARYLVGCIESLINQTYRNIEIIIVNDGSVDNTEDIIKNIQAFDKRVKSITQPNAGLPAARNSGIDIATGKYIAFVDADDTMELHGIEEMVALMNDNVDFVVASNSELWLYRKEFHLKNHLFKAGTIDECFLDYIKKVVTAWKKLYRKSIIDKYHLRFDETMRFAEDYYFNIKYSKYIQNDVVFSSSIVYNYYTYRSSQHKRYFPDMYQYYTCILDAAFDYFEGKDFKSEYKKYFAEFYLTTLIEYYTFNASKNEAEENIFKAYQCACQYFDSDIIKALFTEAQYDSLSQNNAKGFMKSYYGKQLPYLNLKAAVRDELLTLKKKIIL